ASKRKNRSSEYIGDTQHPNLKNSSMKSMWLSPIAKYLFSTVPDGVFRFLGSFCLVTSIASAAASLATANETGALSFNTNGLPPRSFTSGPPLRPVVPWVQTHLRIAHVPPADWRQIQEYVRAGYQVIAVNTLEKWDHVGPRSVDYPEKVVKEADAYLRRI